MNDSIGQKLEVGDIVSYINTGQRIGLGVVTHIAGYSLLLRYPSATRKVQNNNYTYKFVLKRGRALATRSIKINPGYISAVPLNRPYWLTLAAVPDDIKARLQTEAIQAMFSLSNELRLAAQNEQNKEAST